MDRAERIARQRRWHRDRKMQSLVRIASNIGRSQEKGSTDHPAEELGLYPVHQGAFLRVLSRVAVMSPEPCSRTIHEPRV